MSEHHDHEHEHHHHEEELGEMSPKEKKIVLLEHMVHHNEHHAKEMKELAEGAEGAASSKILAAVADFEEGNAKLREAIDLLKGGK